MAKRRQEERRVRRQKKSRKKSRKRKKKKNSPSRRDPEGAGGYEGEVIQLREALLRVGAQRDRLAEAARDYKARLEEKERQTALLVQDNSAVKRDMEAMKRQMMMMFQQGETP